jgi:Xaa-Pro dipeptidase
MTAAMGHPIRQDSGEWPQFSAAEYEARWSKIDGILASEDLDALVVYSNGAARHELTWLTGWGPKGDGYLVIGGGAPPALYVQMFNHVPTARLMSIIAEVEWGGRSSAATVADDLRRRGRQRRVGLVGQIPWSAHAELTGSLPGVALVDAGPAFRRLRLVKSDEEIAWTRRGAELCDAAMETLVAEARPGLTEHELGALVEGAYARLGGTHGICFIATGPMGGGGRTVPSQHWSRRLVEAGDAILIELSAGVGGYTGQVLRTIAVGAEPPPAMLRLHAVAEQAFDALAAAVRPGVSAAELQAVAGLIDEAGFTVCDDVVHGYGGGYLPPILRTPATAHGAAPDLTMLAGMMVVIQPNVITADGSLGVQTGELLLVTETGSESLHRLPRGLLRATGGGRR